MDLYERHKSYFCSCCQDRGNRVKKVQPAGKELNLNFNFTLCKVHDYHYFQSVVEDHLDEGREVSGLL